MLQNGSKHAGWGKDAYPGVGGTAVVIKSKEILVLSLFYLHFLTIFKLTLPSSIENIPRWKKWTLLFVSSVQERGQGLQGAFICVLEKHRHPVQLRKKKTLPSRKLMAGAKPAESLAPILEQHSEPSLSSRSLLPHSFLLPQKLISSNVMDRMILNALDLSERFWR